MVATIKFSQFIAGPTLAAGMQPVGVFSGANVQFATARQFIGDFTNATRPVGPPNGSIGYNTDLGVYQYFDETAWVSIGVGTGTVEDVNTGTGLTGGPITVSGTISLASISNNNLLANISGVSAAPTPHTLSALIDSAISSTQGSMLYRNASAWVALPPGSIGQTLTTGGPAANLFWQTDSGTGTVTEVDTGTGLTGGPITTTGTISFASVADQTYLGNISGGAAVPIANAFPLGLMQGGTNADLSSPSSGGIVYSTATTLAILANPGISNQVVMSQGAGFPIWSTSTYPVTNATNDLMIGIGTNGWGSLLTTNNAVLTTDPTGTPTWSTDPFTKTAVVTATAAELKTAGKVNIFVAPTGTAQVAILDIKVFKSTGLSAGGGDRLLSLTDGTLVFNDTGITAALLGTPIFTLWGGSGNPLPSATEATISTAGANVFLQYISGAADYTTGSVIIAVTYVQTVF